MCVCVIIGSYSRRNQKQSREEKCKSGFSLLVFAIYAVCCCCVHVSNRQLLTLSRPSVGSHGTTAALEAFSFVTATKGGSVCCLCVRVCVCHHRILQQDPTAVGTRNTSLKNKGGDVQLSLLFFIFVKLPAAAVCLYHTVSFWRCGSHVGLSPYFKALVL